MVMLHFANCAGNKFCNRKVLTETTFKYKCHAAAIKQFSTSIQTLLTQKMQPSFNCNASTKYRKIHCDILQGKLQPEKRAKTRT